MPMSLFIIKGLRAAEKRIESSLHFYEAVKMFERWKYRYDDTFGYD